MVAICGIINVTMNKCRCVKTFDVELGIIFTDTNLPSDIVFTFALQAKNHVILEYFCYKCV